jgi:hypothetical protein
MCTDKLLPPYSQKLEKLVIINHMENIVVCEKITVQVYRASLKEYSGEITITVLCSTVHAVLSMRPYCSCICTVRVNSVR